MNMTTPIKKRKDMTASLINNFQDSKSLKLLPFPNLFHAHPRKSTKKRNKGTQKDMEQKNPKGHGNF
uniref:Uncharacterized protein n=1 Tax=Rhizophora mucronata TaxID=61149 RepID=A0A2P2QVL0_RHIMU